MKNVYKLISELLDRKENFVLVTILKKSGSVPREEGTKMLVRKDFSIWGTIGGGLFEAMAIKLSSKVFKNGEFIIENLTVADSDASSLGLVCGGDVNVLLEYVDCNDNVTVDMYRKAIELKKSKTDFAMITKISEGQKRITGQDKWICTETGFYGTENEGVQSIIKRIRESFNKTKMQEVSLEKEIYLIEPFLNFESAYIIGAGHVAQKIAAVTKNLGFYTVVIDDREEFSNRERFSTADEIKVIPSFNHLLDYVAMNYNSYIIILTRGHAYDKEVLAQMLKTDARYIGMIGSRKKRDYIYGCLLDEGFTSKDLERVHCPIGLPIYAETPEEIAISIAAELIMDKRGPKNEKC